MSAEKVVRYCSPTLAGLKTGSIFKYNFKDHNDMVTSVRAWNKLLVKKGIRMTFLRYDENNSALIYIFRPSHLMRDFKSEMTTKILTERGYTVDTPDICVAELAKKLSENGEFPHEIGLFLGYPPEDVSGFIENKAKAFKICGPWKVYGDEDKAKKLFAKYKKCTTVYCNHLANGTKIEKLIVAGR